MVRKPGSKHSVPSSRVTARRNDWNSIRDLHQGPRSKAAFRGRIHDRSRFVCRNAKKSLPRGGRPYMTANVASLLAMTVPKPTLLAMTGSRRATLSFSFVIVREGGG